MTPLEDHAPDDANEGEYESDNTKEVHIARAVLICRSLVSLPI